MRPIFILIALDSATDLTAKLIDRVTSIRVTDAEGTESDTLEIELDDRHQIMQLPETGQRLRLMLGYAGGPVETMGDFVVDELGLSGPPLSMTISAKGADLLGGIKAPKAKTEQPDSLGKLAETIADRHGFEADIHAEAFTHALPHIDQWGESDMAVLGRMAGLFDMTMKLAAKTLTLRPHAARLALNTREILATDLTSYQWRGRSRTKYTAVRASYYDPDKAARIPVTVGDGEAGPVLELRHDARDAAEAATLAQTRSRQMARGTASLSLELPGVPGLRAGDRLMLRGLNDPVGGTWVVERITHRLDAKGYITSVECMPPDAKENNDEV